VSRNERATPNLLPGWCVVLGASSGFGAAACRAFAEAGLDVIGVHLDRRATLAKAEAVAEHVEAQGRRVWFQNANAADATKRAEIAAGIRERVGDGPGVRVLLHSLAFGSLGPLVDPAGGASPKQIAMTLDVMATSLVDWTQALLGQALFEPGGRVFAMTSEGGRRAIPGYGPVGVAKAALEAVVRQLALELAPHEVTANAICAGVTRTPALDKIPGAEALAEAALRRNPRGRLTRPEDVAGALVALTLPGCDWVTGNVIGVDGGEGITP
jgi:NAD(P)-dependent dehydrogenase (short-subunit alcohol dehydrogenase family)